MNWLKRQWNRFKRWFIALFVGGAIASVGVLGLLPSDPAQYEHVYLSNWEWHTELDGGSYWRCPGGDCTGVLDLRALPQMSKAGGVPEGYGVFSYEGERTIPGAVLIGKDEEVEVTDEEGTRIEQVSAINHKFTAIEKAEIELLFGAITAETPQDFLWEMLTTKSDPTGQTAPKPLRGKLGEEIVLYFAGNPIKAERFDEAHRQRTIAVFQADYERNKNNGAPLETLQKMTGGMMQDLYGRKTNGLAREIIPSPHKDDGWKEPKTTLIDTFEDTDNTSLDAHTNTGGGDEVFTWAEVDGSWNINNDGASSTAESSFNQVDFARAEADLSSDNHYAQVDIVALADFQQAGVIARFSSSASTFYVARVDNENSNSFEILKSIAGTETQLADLDNQYPLTASTVKLEAQNCALSLFWGGVLKVSVQDCSISGNLRTGIDQFNVQALLDDFKAEDLFGALNEANVHERVDTFTADGNWMAPTGVTSVKVETWGAGGGGSTGVGGGGGGAYSASTTVVVAGNSYDIVVGTSAENTDGASSSIAFAGEDLVHAEGGLSGTNGGTGGTAASSTGTTKFSGGNGVAGGASTAGGGGAGDSANGSGNAGGAVNGGWAQGFNSVGNVPSGGGGSSGGDQRIGARGEVRVTYDQGTPDDYAHIVARSYNRETADTTSHAITMPSGIVAGDLLLAVFTSDGVVTSSAAGWTELGDESSDANQQAIYYKVAEGSDTLTVTTSASEQSSHIVLRIENGGTPTATVASSTATTNANPPSHDAGSSAKYLWIATGGWDGFQSSIVINEVSSPPAGYSDFIFQTQGSANGGAHTAISNRFAEKQTEDPSAWTSWNEGWVSFTIAVPFEGGAAAAATGSGSSGIQIY